jgi:hypothetical protein
MQAAATRPVLVPSAAQMLQLTVLWTIGRIRPCRLQLACHVPVPSWLADWLSLASDGQRTECTVGSQYTDPYALSEIPTQHGDGCRAVASSTCTPGESPTWLKPYSCPAVRRAPVPCERPQTPDTRPKRQNRASWFRSCHCSGCVGFSMSMPIMCTVSETSALCKYG